MIRKIFVLILIICPLSFLGCATSQMERTVSSSNEFYSPYAPPIQVNVNPEFTYLGEIQDIQFVSYNNRPTDGTPVTIHKYIFVKLNDRDHVEKEIMIRIMTVEEGIGYARPDFYGGIKNPIDSGFTEINGDQYQYCTIPCRMDSGKIRSLVSGKEYSFYHTYLAKALGRRADAGSKTRFEIFYLEHLSDLKSAKQTEFLKKFENNMQKSFQIMPSDQPS